MDAGKKFLDALQLGGAGEDVTLDASSAFLRNIFGGISAGVMEQDGNIKSSTSLKNSYIFTLSSSDLINTSIQPVLYPFPLKFPNLHLSI